MSEQERYLEFILSRRSIRVFKPEPVPLELLEKIVDIARYAPSSKNRQPWNFIIVTERSIIEKLSQIHRWSKPLRGAPACIVVASDVGVSPVSYQVDGANAAMYIMFAAHALGLGTVWIQTLRNIGNVQEILGLPENLVPIAIIAIGWPAERPEPRPRKSLSEIAFLNRYGEPLRKHG